MQTSQEEKTFLGQPKPLSTLFFTESWERFSYYGMRALLIFYLVAKVTDPNAGLGISQGQAAQIVSIYSGLVYLSSIGGAWLADRLWGSGKTVFLGAWCITFGHLALATPFGIYALVTSLTLIIIGSGLLKPNIVNMVGNLYDRNDPRRDTGFQIAYFGANFGAFVAPILVGTVGQKYNFHLGFSFAAFGMILGLTAFVINRKKQFADNGKLPGNPLAESERKKFYTILTVVIVAIVAVIVGLTAAHKLSIASIINILSTIGLILPFYYIVKMLISKDVTTDERKKLFAYLPIFACAIVFWAVEEQGSSIIALYSLNRLDLHFLGMEIQPSLIQTLNPLFVITLSPLFVLLWNKLGEKQPKAVTKFAFGLVLTGIAYMILMLPALLFGLEQKVSPLWVVLMFFVMMCGELCVGPIGQSLTNKVAPKAFASQTMALWYMTSSASLAINAQIAPFFKPSTEVAYFGLNGLVVVLFGVVLFVFRKKLLKIIEK